jgi:hypothetical protein
MMMLVCEMTVLVLSVVALSSTRSWSSPPSGLWIVNVACNCEAGTAELPIWTVSEPFPRLTTTLASLSACSRCTPDSVLSKSRLLSKPGSPAVKRLCRRKPSSASKAIVSESALPTKVAVGPDSDAEKVWPGRPAVRPERRRSNRSGRERRRRSGREADC